MSDTSDQYYTVHQVANRLHLSESTVTRLLRAGTLRGMRTGRAGGWHVSRAEFARWLESTSSSDV